MSDPAADAAMAAAMAAGLRTFNTELWTLYAFGVLMTVLRTYARLKSVGTKGLRADDFIVWIALLLYTTLSTLAFYAVNHGQGLANNAMTDTQRSALVVDSREYELRIFGSKIQVAGWTCYGCLICTLKIAVLVFYIRLMEGLSRSFQMRIWIGFGIVGATWFASIITLYSACQPFSKYWQINPDPGERCQAAISLPIVWANFIASLLTDIYLIMIPLPMLWGTKLKLYKKLGATFVLGAGVFVFVCSLLKTTYLVTDPINGAQLAGAWGTREAFVSVITTNLPMILPLIKLWLAPFMSSSLTSAQSNSNKHPSGFRTIGGGDGRGGPSSGSHNRNRKASNSRLSVTESEEQIINDLKMDDLNPGKVVGLKRNPSAANGGIVISSEFKVTEGRTDRRNPENANVIRDSW